ncbi:holin [Arthrobacter phage Kels]|nr:holin [Arthrobacter phage Kels]
MASTNTSPSKLPTAKVTAATAATAAVGLTIALVEWLAGVDVPAAVELPALTLATFAAGYIAPAARRGRHA